MHIVQPLARTYLLQGQHMRKRKESLGKPYKILSLWPYNACRQQDPMPHPFSRDMSQQQQFFLQHRMSHSRGVYFEGDGWCLFTGFSTKRCRLNNVFALETRHIFGRIPHKITIIQSLKRYTQPASEQRAVKQFKILQIHSNIFLLLFLCGHSLFNQSLLRNNILFWPKKSQ